MGAAFSFPLLDNNHKVTLSEPFNFKLINNLKLKKKFHPSLKIKLSEKLVETISPIGKNIVKLMKDKKHLEDVLKKGKQKANIIAEENLKKIREIVGFV